MEHIRALAEDVLAFMPPSNGPRSFVSLYRIIEGTAPLREKEVRIAIKTLVRDGWLTMDRHGNGVPAYYARKPMIRRI